MYMDIRNLTERTAELNRNLTERTSKLNRKNQTQFRGRSGRRSRARRHTQRAGAPTGKVLHKVLLTMLNFTNTIKLYHWRTSSFAEHKATDELFENLQSNIDKFVEVLLGRTYGGRISHPAVFHIVAHNYNNAKMLHREVAKFRAFLISLENTMGKNDTDLINIRDDILVDINKFMYLMSLR
jgi:DNA-binding ferritin-like protein